MVVQRIIKCTKIVYISLFDQNKKEGQMHHVVHNETSIVYHFSKWFYKNNTIGNDIIVSFDLTNTNEKKESSRSKWTAHQHRERTKKLGPTWWFLPLTEGLTIAGCTTGRIPLLSQRHWQRISTIFGRLQAIRTLWELFETPFSVTETPPRQLSELNRRR